MIEPRLKIPILLSILAAIITLGLKWLAYSLTGSVGLLSEAVESAVNLLAAVTAYVSLAYASRPVDPTHTYGHEKIEYFSCGLEGGLIVIAAGGIFWYATVRLLDLRAPEQLSVGVLLTVLASVLNLIVAILLLRAGRSTGSIVLEADGLHLLTDVWTSFAVIAGLGLVWVTGKAWFDPLMGLIIALHVLRTGWRLILRSFNGLMDHALPLAEQSVVREAIRTSLRPGMDFHALRTRQAGARRFVDFHLLVPGALSVRHAHDLGQQIEDAIRNALPGTEITIHIEPIEDRISWEDSELVPLEQETWRVQAQNQPPN
jgi:cation diffusion facilitator family transporter